MAAGFMEQEQAAILDAPGCSEAQNVGGAAVLACDLVVVAGQEIAGPECGRLRVHEPDIKRIDHFAKEVAHLTRGKPFGERGEGINGCPPFRRIVGHTDAFIPILEASACLGVNGIVQRLALGRRQGCSGRSVELDIATARGQHLSPVGATAEHEVKRLRLALGEHLGDMHIPVAPEGVAECRPVEVWVEAKGHAFAIAHLVTCA